MDNSRALRMTKTFILPWLFHKKRIHLAIFFTAQCQKNGHRVAAEKADPWYATTAYFILIHQCTVSLDFHETYLSVTQRIHHGKLSKRESKEQRCLLVPWTEQINALDLNTVDLNSFLFVIFLTALKPSPKGLTCHRHQGDFSIN